MILGKRALYFTGVTSDFKTKHVDHIYTIIKHVDHIYIIINDI